MFANDSADFMIGLKLPKTYAAGRHRGNAESLGLALWSVFLKLFNHFLFISKFFSLSLSSSISLVAKECDY